MTAPATRTLPIPAAHREFTVKVNGSPVPRESHLAGMSITKAVNRIATARLAYLDGSASRGDFPLSNGSLFVPGNSVEVLAGATDDPVSLFQGIVIRHGIQVRDDSAPQLVVECRHKATKLTVGRKSACFFAQTDSDVISAILNQAHVSADVERTTTSHPQLVQFRSTDWDFLLARAEASGKLVFTNTDSVVVKAPNAGSAAVCELHFGATIIELDAVIDARLQFGAVTAVSWDQAQQTVVETTAADPGVAGPGNFSADDLAAVVALDSERLLHTGIAQDEAQTWADAAWVKSRLSKVSGRVKCEGIGIVNPGDVVTLSGAGERFSGDVFVTGVRHQFDAVQGWKTHLQFGDTASWATERPDVSAPKAGGLVPGVSGLQIGTVVSNEDGDGEHRVRVRLPLVNDQDDGVWARVAAVDAGADRGFFFRPEVGDEVVLGFLDDDPRRAVMLGMLHSSANAAPLQGSNDNHEKVYQSRSHMKLYFNDDKKVVQLETPAGNRMTLSEDAKAVTLADQNGNTIELNQDGISIRSSKAIALKAGTEVTLESGTAFSAKGGTDLTLQGTSGAELSSAATTAVKGSLVQIN